MLGASAGSHWVAAGHFMIESRIRCLVTPAIGGAGKGRTEPSAGVLWAKAAPVVIARAAATKMDVRFIRLLPKVQWQAVAYP
jgi:hypothetical protein